MSTQREEQQKKRVDAALREEEKKVCKISFLCLKHISLWLWSSDATDAIETFQAAARKVERLRKSTDNENVVKKGFKILSSIGCDDTIFNLHHKTCQSA